MSLRNCIFRSFTIILIVPAITSRVQTFTINAPLISTASDLDAEASSLVQVKPDVKYNQIERNDKDVKSKEKIAKSLDFSLVRDITDIPSTVNTNIVSEVAPDSNEELLTTVIALTNPPNAKVNDEDTTEVIIANNSDKEKNNNTPTNQTGSSTTKKADVNSVPTESVIFSLIKSSPRNKQKINIDTKPSETITTETILEPESIETTAPWKKYTIIERKKIVTDSNQEINTESSSTKEAETTVTPVLETTTTTKSEAKKTTDKSESTDSTTNINSPVKDNKRVDTTSSIRTETTDLATASTTITENTSNGENYPTVTLSIIELQEVDMSDSQIIKDKSRSQLVNDATNEEQLLMEESMNNNEQNSKKYVDQKKDNKDSTPQNSLVNQESVKTNQNLATTDRLNVKPIVGEKGKNTSLYAVNPNYKPLKKIDIQPPKSFLRNPDDNSWRNESISSLGIVFKPKNATKAFTQVLKNKTESILNNLETENKSDEQPEQLRIRLEKIGELRKSKKKNKLGETVYTDYDANNSDESVNTPQSKDEVSKEDEPTTVPIQNVLTTVTNTERITTKSIAPDHISTEKAKKFNIQEYYELMHGHDDEEDDYEVMPKMELKKFLTTKPTISFKPYPLLHKHEEPALGRHATVQYFPPLPTVKYFDDSKSRLPSFRREERPGTVVTRVSTTVPTEPSTTNGHLEQSNPYSTTSSSTESSNQDDEGRNFYYTRPPTGAYNEEIDRPAYVIKHFGDLFKQSSPKEEAQLDIIPAYTIAPPVYSNEPHQTDKARTNIDYDYDDQFRKDVIDKFVENFNQNRDRFKEDFPILYNSSIVHQKAEENGKVLASSSAYLKRLYPETQLVPDRGSSYFVRNKPCDPDCDKTVELSPAYELHYYVPDEEEKQEILPKLTTAVYNYRL